MAGRRLQDLRDYFRQPPVMLALLAGLAVIFFAAVTGLSRAYQAQREALGQRWFSRGLADLKAQRFDSAMTEFRSALLYSRDDYAYQLNLAEALIGLKRTSEASAYLVNLWDRQPEDGLVNLELARIEAQKGQTEEALRYYHDAIYSAWPSDQESKRREARLELVEFLLSTRGKAQAQSELIALEENMGDDPAQQERMGDLFLRAQDYEHALAAYRVSLKTERDNAAALAGAGAAAFQLGRYPQALRYLQAAVAANPDDTQSAERLKMAEMVVEMDPFRRQIPVAQRDRIVMEAFATAGERVKTCGGEAQASWAQMNPRITELGLKRNPDLVEAAMDLVFAIERQSSGSCGSGSGKDAALLLIAKLHEGN